MSEKTNLLALKEYYVFVNSEGDFYKIKESSDEVHVSTTNLTTDALKGNYEDMKRYYKNLKEESNLTGVLFSPISLLRIVELIEEKADSKISIEDLIENIELESNAGKYKSAQKSFTLKHGKNSVQKNNNLFDCNCSEDSLCDCLMG